MWVRDHSRSLILVPFENLGAVSYSPSIGLVTMAISCIVCEIYRSDLFVKNREIFIPNLYLAPPQGVTPSKLANMFNAHKTRMIGLPCCEKNYDNVKPCPYNTGMRRTDIQTEML